jgi:hypothetical protein
MVLRLPEGREIVFCSKSLFSIGTKASFPGVRRPDHEAEHLTACSAKVMNE